MRYMIIQKETGYDFGVYEGATPTDAIQAMLDDVGHDGNSDPRIVALEVEDEPIRFGCRTGLIAHDDIRDEHIARLQDEAARAGDHDMVKACEVALGVHMTDGSYPTEQERREAREQVWTRLGEDVSP